MSLTTYEDGTPIYSYKGELLPDPPEGYAWTYLSGEPRLGDTARGEARFSTHRGWISEMPDGTFYVVASRHGYPSVHIPDLETPRDAIEALVTAICLGEPT